jgi:hypothetical protein
MAATVSQLPANSATKRAAAAGLAATLRHCQRLTNRSRLAPLLPEKLRMLLIPRVFESAASERRGGGGGSFGLWNVVVPQARRAVGHAADAVVETDGAAWAEMWLSAAALHLTPDAAAAFDALLRAQLAIALRRTHHAAASASGRGRDFAGGRGGRGGGAAAAAAAAAAARPEPFAAQVLSYLRSHRLGVAARLTQYVTSDPATGGIAAVTDPQLLLDATTDAARVAELRQIADLVVRGGESAVAAAALLESRLLAVRFLRRRCSTTPQRP